MASVQFLLLVCQLFLSYFIRFIIEDLTATVHIDSFCWELVQSHFVEVFFAGYPLGLVPI